MPPQTHHAWFLPVPLNLDCICPREILGPQQDHTNFTRAANQPGFYLWEPMNPWLRLRLPHRLVLKGATNRRVSCIDCRMSCLSPLLCCLRQGRVDLDRLLQRRELAMDWIVDEFGRWCTHPTDGETLCSELQIVSCLACTSGQIQIVTELTQDYSFWDRWNTIIPFGDRWSTIRVFSK